MRMELKSLRVVSEARDDISGLTLGILSGVLYEKKIVVMIDMKAIIKNVKK